MRPLAAQLRAEVIMIMTNGETLFLTLGIPVLFLLFFSGVHVLPTETSHPVDFLVPGILALAIMSTAMVALGIGTGFDRGYGVLKRLAATPLGRPRLLGAKIISVVGVELIQVVVLILVGWALGWSPGGGRNDAGVALAVMVLGTMAFAGIGLFLAGLLRALVNLAVVNSLFVVLLLLGGMLIPLAKLPGWLAGVAKVLPAAALADALHSALGGGHERVGRGLVGAGRLGRGRPGAGVAHLPLGMTRGSRPLARPEPRPARRRAGASGPPAQEPPPTSRLVHCCSSLGVSAPNFWPMTCPVASMKNVLGCPFSA